MSQVLSDELRADVLRRLESIDVQFAKDSMPAKQRPLKAAAELARQLPRDFPRGFPINSDTIKLLFGFFEDRYGDNAVVHLLEFSVPYRYQGEIYFYKIPILINFKQSSFEQLDLTKWLEVPDGLKAKLKADAADLAAFRKDFEAHLGTSRIFGKPAEFPGASAYHMAVEALRKGRRNDVAWNALQAAEKSMKALLKAKGVNEKERRKLGHNLQAILDRVKKDFPEASDLDGDVAVCNEPNVDFRYEEVDQFTIEQAYNKTRSAFSIWALSNDLAQRLGVTP